ncbi:hypothetical protein ASE14_01060 [Agromyces sp. Root81]|uniref:hypothetical protein n=1 Tax=Agromyces sp. Root81 TaxID=1736601 RepID=UPI0006FAB078|nr:hypothetical protein [Agromyces sp. Root81]KRC62458.1 hypothetical protein ASE14_01060 [Agromyces sp. Root81]
MEREIRTRDAIAAATVCIPFLVFIATWIAWADRLPPAVSLRNDISDSSPMFPTWVVIVGVAIVLAGAGIGAIFAAAGGVGDTQSPRVPLFWAGAVAGFVCAIWIFQILFAINPPMNPGSASAVAGFTTIGAAAYGLIPFLIASKPKLRHAWAA